MRGLLNPGYCLPAAIILQCWLSLPFATAATYVQPFPKDMDKVDFYLHTQNVGNLVFNNFGHTAIRVHDRQSRRNLIYNWGIFDFDTPLSFSLRFFKGILRYELGISSMSTTMRRYRREQRTTWENKLNLTRQQKIRLMERLRWHSRAENRHYNYLYFFDNCSTRPRDYIDEALGGRFRSPLHSQDSGRTYREMVRSHYAALSFIRIGLETVMNSNLDRNMSVWEHMFLPLILQQVWMKQINPENGLPVLGESRVLMEGAPPVPWPVHGFALLALCWLGPVLWLLVWFVYRPWRTGGVKMPGRLAYRSMGFLAILWGSWAGLVGVVSSVTWIWSGHIDLHHNANLLIFWPVDFLLIIGGWGWLIKGRPLFKGFPLVRALRLLCLLHGSVIIFTGLAWAAGLIRQDMSQILWGSAWVSLSFFLVAFVSGFGESGWIRSGWLHFYRPPVGGGPPRGGEEANHVG